MIKRSVLYSEWERERLALRDKWEKILQIYSRQKMNRIDRGNIFFVVASKQNKNMFLDVLKSNCETPGAVISIQSFIPSFFHPLSFHTHYFGTKDCFLIQLLQTVELVENIYVYIFPTHWRLDWCPKLKWPMTKTSDLSTKSLSSNWADIFFYS